MLVYQSIMNPGDDRIADEKIALTPVLLILTLAVLLIGIPAIVIFYLPRNFPWQIIAFLAFAAGLLYYFAKLVLSPNKPLPSPARWAMEEQERSAERVKQTGSDEPTNPEEDEESFKELEAEMERDAIPEDESEMSSEAYGPEEEEEQDQAITSSYDEIISYVEESFSPPWVRDEADLEAKLFAQLNTKFPGMVQKIEGRAVNETGINIEDTYGLDARVIESEKDLLATIGQAGLVKDNYDKVALVLFIDRYLASKLDLQPYLSRLEESGIQIIVKEGFIDNKQAR